MSFLAELKRRNVHRAMAAYVAGAWLITEITGMLTEVYGAPEWVMKVVLALFIAGVIPAAIISWFYELTTSGLQKDEDSTPASSVAMKRGFNTAIVLMLAASVSIFLLFRDEISGVDETVLDSAAVTEPAATEEKPAGGPPMIAVLPFSSSSLDGDSAFFATGIHDDLLTQLAQLKSIRVISRTSVLEYKDVQRNIREIGQQLGADTILEGHVQSAGDRIRINAQLIDAHTDEHLWAETYDRELTVSNIFDVQSEIALAIATAMKASHSDSEEQALSLLPTNNMAAYRAFHEAMKLRNVHGGSGSPEYSRWLRQAVELDPDFSRAWSYLVGSLTLSLFNRDDPELLREAEQALGHLGRIAPNSVDYLQAQAFYTYYVLKDYETALALIEQAIERNPSDVHMLETVSWIQRRMADWDGQIETLRKIRQLDPANTRWTSSLAYNLVMQHRYDEARRIAEAHLEANPLGNSPGVQEIWIEFLANFLEVAKHRDAGKFLEAVQEMHSRYPETIGMEDVWDAFLINRHYESAASSLDGFSEHTRRRHPESVLAFQETRALITAWVLEDSDRLEGLLEGARAHLATLEPMQGELVNASGHIQMAMVSAMSGQPRETLEWVRSWEHFAATDAAMRMLNLHLACVPLGIAGLDSEATACLRTAFSEPGSAAQFYDPWLPMYDPVRNLPEFSQLMAELTVEYGPLIVD